MKVLILSAWEDTGGVGIALKTALEKYTDWEARFVHRHYNYIEYPTDIYWAPDTPKPAGLDDLFIDADVIHVMERATAVTPFSGWEQKPLVMHHHGTEFRVDNTEFLRNWTTEHQATVIVSTPDLLCLDPRAEWLPNPVDIGQMEALRSVFYVGGRTKVSHSPTNRSIKGTEVFLAAAENVDIDVDVIEWVNHEQCLVRKAGSDIFFDQLHIGYALSGIEAMAMGIPVIGGAYDPSILELMERTFGYIPFRVATEGSLPRVLKEMAEIRSLRKDYEELGRMHVNRYHDEEKVAKQLVGIYERALR